MSDAWRPEVSESERRECEIGGIDRGKERRKERGDAKEELCC